MTDPALEALQARIRAAAKDSAPLRIRGGGTKDFYGGTLNGEILDTRVYAGIVDYEPNELVITARAGTTVAAVESAMRARGQMLAFEPPRYGDGGTLGGAIASGLSGPRRPYAGAVRDLILGVRIIDGAGTDLSFGGRVMKNVAGFDVSRLMTGAMGTLGVITEVSLKCLPLPRTEATLAFECSADESIRMVNEWGGQPLPLSATSFHHGSLRVRLSGAAPAVAAAAKRLGGEAVAEGEAFWARVRDHSHIFFAGTAQSQVPLWRLSVKSTAPYTDLGGEQLIEWGGALRWLAGGEHTDAAKLRRWARTHGGHATLFRATRKDVPVFHPLDEPLATLHRNLKAVFDPHAAFSTAAVCWANHDPHPLMHTQLTPEFSGTREGEEAQAILRSCVHCGFCTATCPTYQLLGDELDGPRGRIYLIKEVLEGASVTAKTQTHLDRCLTCLSCETTCPSGVQYGKLVDIGRAIVERKVGRSAAGDGAALGFAPRAAVADAVRRSAGDGPDGQGPAAEGALGPDSVRRTRGCLAGAAARAQDGDHGGLRAAVASSRASTPRRPGCSTASAYRHCASPAAVAAARCRTTCPPTRKRGRSSSATSTRGGRMFIAASRRSW